MLRMQFVHNNVCSRIFVLFEYIYRLQHAVACSKLTWLDMILLFKIKQQEQVCSLIVNYMELVV